MNICIFCGPTTSPLTLEHVWPQWLSELMRARLTGDKFHQRRKTGNSVVNEWDSNGRRIGPVRRALSAAVLAAVAFVGGDGIRASGLPQTAPPIFRTEAYVVAIDFEVVIKRAFVRRPYKDLTLADVSVLLDENVYQPVALTPDPKKPGRYLLNFTPAPQYRDGERHGVELTLKVKGFRDPWVIQQEAVFPKPVEPAQAAR